ncbi:MAG: Gfo/Idh/MocA family oxidoreductase [Terrimicrobiaceae bacterium]|nr:Gfo/Idh/MocA family oxidoreductase [Terrimicrobiaceae bacterium]
MKTRVGVIGCGNIAKAYFPTIQKFAHLDLAACADLNAEVAKAKAAEFGVPRVLTPDRLIADPDIDLVLNLTIPAAHAEIDQAALNAGKHVFSEKPFALTREEGLSVAAVAGQAKRRVGCAPDTVLGGGHQTCRQLIDSGAIGRPIGFTANMLGGGHETWHPSPEFYYEKGGGPVFDMGPYYLHALIALLGPVRRVSGSASITYAERTITSQPKAGKIVRVEVPTHVLALLEFADGVTGTFSMSFDLRGRHSNPCLEVYGDGGSLRVPDPNGFGGKVEISRGRDEWQEIPPTHGYLENTRGLGLADLAAALASGRDHRANERIALHAVDVMQAIHESSTERRWIDLTTTCKRPLPMKAGLPEFVLDEFAP